MSAGGTLLDQYGEAFSFASATSGPEKLDDKKKATQAAQVNLPPIGTNSTRQQSITETTLYGIPTFTNLPSMTEDGEGSSMSAMAGLDSSALSPASSTSSTSPITSRFSTHSAHSSQSAPASKGSFRSSHSSRDAVYVNVKPTTPGVSPDSKMHMTETLGNNTTQFNTFTRSIDPEPCATSFQGFSSYGVHDKSKDTSSLSSTSLSSRQNEINESINDGFVQRYLQNDVESPSGVVNNFESVPELVDQVNSLQPHGARIQRASRRSARASGGVSPSSSLSDASGRRNSSHSESGPDNRCIIGAIIIGFFVTVLIGFLIFFAYKIGSFSTPEGLPDVLIPGSKPTSYSDSDLVPGGPFAPSIVPVRTPHYIPYDGRFVTYTEEVSGIFPSVFVPHTKLDIAFSTFSSARVTTPVSGQTLFDTNYAGVVGDWVPPEVPIEDDAMSIALVTNAKRVFSTAYNPTTMYTPQAFLLVEFYIDWCGHCRKAAKEVERAGLAFNRIEFDNATVRTIKVHCGGPAESLCRAFRLQGYPSFFFGPAEQFLAAIASLSPQYSSYAESHPEEFLHAFLSGGTIENAFSKAQDSVVSIFNASQLIRPAAGLIPEKIIPPRVHVKHTAEGIVEWVNEEILKQAFKQASVLADNPKAREMPMPLRILAKNVKTPSPDIFAAAVDKVVELVKLDQEEEREYANARREEIVREKRKREEDANTEEITSTLPADTTSNTATNTSTDISTDTTTDSTILPDTTIPADSSKPFVGEFVNLHDVNRYIAQALPTAIRKGAFIMKDIARGYTYTIGDEEKPSSFLSSENNSSSTAFLKGAFEKQRRAMLLSPLQIATLHASSEGNTTPLRMPFISSDLDDLYTHPSILSEEEDTAVLNATTCYESLHDILAWGCAAYPSSPSRAMFCAARDELHIYITPPPPSLVRGLGGSLSPLSVAKLWSNPKYVESFASKSADDFAQNFRLFHPTTAKENIVTTGSSITTRAPFLLPISLAEIATMEWKTCKGTGGGRGFTCGKWLFLHSLASGVVDVENTQFKHWISHQRKIAPSSPSSPSSSITAFEATQSIMDSLPRSWIDVTKRLEQGSFTQSPTLPSSSTLPLYAPTLMFLQAVRSYLHDFFDCEGCRAHFLKYTWNLAPKLVSVDNLLYPFTSITSGNTTDSKLDFNSFSFGNFYVTDFTQYKESDPDYERVTDPSPVLREERDVSAPFLTPLSPLRRPSVQLVMWLWETHNKINSRLFFEEKEDENYDPSFVKVLFPSFTACPTCFVSEDQIKILLDVVDGELKTTVEEKKNAFNALEMVADLLVSTPDEYNEGDVESNGMMISVLNGRACAKEDYLVQETTGAPIVPTVATKLRDCNMKAVWNLYETNKFIQQHFTPYNYVNTIDAGN